MAGVVALSVAGLLAASTSANLILEQIEKSHTVAYGEKVHLNEGTINVDPHRRDRADGRAAQWTRDPCPGARFCPLGPGNARLPNSDC